MLFEGVRKVIGTCVEICMVHMYVEQYGDDMIIKVTVIRVTFMINVK